MADRASLCIPVKVTELSDALLVEIAPESPKGVTFALPFDRAEWERTLNREADG